MGKRDPLKLKACRACLATDVKLFNLHELGLAQIFGHLSKAPVLLMDEMPQFICFYCRAQLQRFRDFRAKCRLAQACFQENKADKHLVSTDDLKVLDRSKFSMPLKTVENFVIDYEPKESYQEDNFNCNFTLDHLNDNLKLENDFNDVNNDYDSDLVNFDDHEEIKFDNEDLKDNDHKNIKTENINTENSIMSETEVKIEVDDEDIIPLIQLKEEKYLEANKIASGIKEEETKRSKKKVILKEKKAEKTKTEKSTKKKKCNKYNEKFEEDFEEFSKTYNVKVVCLSKEEQLQRMEERKESKEFKESRFSCDVCYKGFMTETAYKRHMVSHDPNSGPNVCDICHMRYPTPRRLRTHVRSHKKIFVCTLCDQVNINTTRAKLHARWHKGVKFECNICHKEYNAHTTYLSHMRGAHKPVRCTVCGMSFTGTLQLTSHHNQSHTQRECQTCARVFQDSTALKRHSDAGCTPRTIPCVLCGENFTARPDLNEHMKTQHTAEGETFTCEECGAVFTTDRALGIHFANAHFSIKRRTNKTADEKRRTNKTADEKQYLCEWCAKSFPCPAQLKIHLQIHSGEKPYRCPMCPKSFRYKSALEIHINVHTGDRPYKCRLCPESFKSYAQRYKHNLMVHTRERRHKCSMCDKSYVIVCDLKAHVRFTHLHEPRPPRNRRRNQQDKSEPILNKKKR